MHELACPSCGSASQFDLTDYILMCPYCSTSFHMNIETGVKELVGDHYIIPATSDAMSVKDSVMEWLKRMHHNPKMAEKEFIITNIANSSIPFWVISLEAHTVWKGLVRKQNRNFKLSQGAGSEFLLEKGQFRRDYRWAVSARSNICELWGMSRLHEPLEPINVEWDGFPLDSTWSKGQISSEQEKLIYGAREFFDFKYSNGFPILGVQVSEEEAMRRAQDHVRLFHYRMASLNVDYLLDQRTELEIAGIQLIHLPIWNVSYVYRPNNYLRHFYKPSERHLLMDGYSKAILTAELALVRQDKLKINAAVCGASSAVFLFIGLLVSSIMVFVGLTLGVIALASLYISSVRQEEENQQRIKARNITPMNSTLSKPKAVMEKKPKPKFAS